MSTVYARFGGGQIADETTPAVPTLATLMDRIGKRMPWELMSPLTIDGATFAKASEEMRQIRLKAGYSDLPTCDLPQRNFLLYGVPIVRGD